MAWALALKDLRGGRIRADLENPMLSVQELYLVWLHRRARRGERRSPVSPSGTMT